MIASYEIVFKPYTKKYHIISKEISVCPICFNKLVTKDYRDRYGKTDSDNRINLVVRRFKCISCGKIHTELPDMLFPYKHYISDTFETILNGDLGVCPADNSTIFRWLKWLPLFLKRVEGILRAISQTILKETTHVFYDLSHLGHFMNLGPGWLGKLIRHVINSGFY